MKNKDITPYNENGNPHGYWERYYSNGNLGYKGNYVDGKQHGYWESYYYNGNLAYKGNYVDGNRHGYWESYWANGNLNQIIYYIR
jgi:antitoxin component YwqK of YwqJK toxin-antitoxin module